MTTGGRGDRQDAARGLDAAVKRQLAEQQHLGDVSPCDVSGCGENAERDGKIERGPGLADVGRCEIHGDSMRRELEPRVPDRAPYAVAAFSHARIRESHHLKRGQAKRDVDLHVHEARVYPEHRRGPHGRQHR
jgi:hypothetical protein